MGDLVTPMLRCIFCPTEGTICVCLFVSCIHSYLLCNRLCNHNDWVDHTGPPQKAFLSWSLRLHLCSSDKSKRRTKTVKKSAEPKWNQTFIYSHVHRRDFRERMLEITVWDQPRVQEEESEFLGEVRVRSVTYKYKYKCRHLHKVLRFAVWVHFTHPSTRWYLSL